MDKSALLQHAVHASYFVAAVLFILGIKRMSSPVTARSGIQWAGIGMVVATIATFFHGSILNHPDVIANVVLMVLAIGISTLFAWVSGKKVAMTDMPQMVALYNGMGGGSAAAIGASALIGAATVGSATAPGHHALGTTQIALAVIGALIGSISFTGSLIAFAKLQGWMDKTFRFGGQQVVNGLFFLSAVGLGGALLFHLDTTIVIAFFAVSLLFGVLMTLPIGGADMPVVISLYNAFTGLAVAFEGYVQGNVALIIAGTVVGAAGTLLTRLMAKAMNRSISNVLFSNFGSGGGGSTEIAGSQKPIEAADAASLLYMAEKVIIVPGYGMAVAQAQHKIWELSQQLIKRDKEVKFAIHPVAGRMPGHMNVLLAEAGVPYDLIADMDDINPEFATCDVAIVIGANDVVNPVARTDKSSPIYGMPILDVINARQVIVIKRGKGAGFAGIENALFYADNCRMLYADGQEAANRLIAELKGIDSAGGH
ncbi:MAG: NAD(P) transhydrogenase subunit beta [Lysobacterales bacterium 69-70]|nr:NAD(P)(+) transhydrogenase (Re/Si-specific) subunit beta [Xanthomonadaceae bacterium]ODU34518.1 MAG: NAD(P) transhydrogenase subunit beta [Xanthomonadaceae bacterium SCN 69-320]ODV19551.1 MAG: NAD(P) transhydrogenase subunit beta [Xanthomonadaceae bacterium SCN 69-25]OJY94761.1 MAG: NAD(P) transhydrogenase subunit beta [Xanthomonadales bacterium 69-70]